MVEMGSPAKILHPRLKKFGHWLLERKQSDGFQINQKELEVYTNEQHAKNDKAYRKKKITIPGSMFSPPLNNDISFSVDDDMIGQKICPQCCGSGKRYAKSVDSEGGSSHGGSEICDLCKGSGIFDYSSLNLDNRVT